MVDEREQHRFEDALDRARRIGRGAARRAIALLSDPVRLLVASIAVLLFIVSVPLLVSGAQRLEWAWSDFQHHRSVDEHWIRAEGTLTEVRFEDGLGFQVTYRDRHGERHHAEVHVDAPGDEWIGTQLPLQYDPLHPERVNLVDVGQPRPLGSALVAGASIGAGLAAAVLAFAVWRRRRLIRVSAHPLQALRIPLATAGVLLVLGLTAWAIGTVTLQGWAGIANRIGDFFATVFGDLLGFLVPIVAFAAGCLLTAWLARHRHHEEHEGMLSSAHRLIDRAAGYVPSPEEMKAQATLDDDAADDDAADDDAAGEATDGEPAEPDPVAVEPSPGGDRSPASRT
jgi:hypothetical protein